MKRRFFLSLAGAAVSTTRGSTQARFDNPFFALCMDTHDDKKRSLAEQADLLKELGFAGAGHLWLDGVQERLATLDRVALRLFQIYIRLDVSPQPKQTYDPRIKDVVPLLKGRGTQLAVLIVGGKPSDATLDERCVQLLRELAEIAEPHGVRIALYPHANHWLEKVQDALRVTRKVGRANTGVMFNLCHWLRVGDEQELQPLLTDAMPLLYAVSINGSDRGDEIKAGTGNWIQPLDSGSFDMYGFLKVLNEMGYRGPMGLQCYGIKGDARLHLARSMAAWQRLVARLSGNS